MTRHPALNVRQSIRIRRLLNRQLRALAEQLGTSHADLADKATSSHGRPVCDRARPGRWSIGKVSARRATPSGRAVQDTLLDLDQHGGDRRHGADSAGRKRSRVRSWLRLTRRLPGRLDAILPGDVTEINRDRRRTVGRSCRGVAAGLDEALPARRQNSIPSKGESDRNGFHRAVVRHLTGRRRRGSLELLWDRCYQRDCCVHAGVFRRRIVGLAILPPIRTGVVPRPL